MSTLDVTSIPLPSPRLRRPRASRWIRALDRSFRWFSRPRRVLFALAAVWVINLLDLGYTLLESLNHGFVELNPLAAGLIGESPTGLVTYKLSLLLISSTILLVYRRHRVAEMGCWFLLVVYMQVAVCWSGYYEHRLASFDDPTVNVDPLIGHCSALPGG